MSWQIPQLTTYLAIWVSGVFALGCLAVTLVLCLRRLIDERHSLELLAADTRLLTQVLVAIEDNGEDPRDALAAADDRRIRRVFSHLFQLVRGDERERLLMLAQSHDVVGPLVSEVRHPSLHRRVEAMRALEYLPVKEAHAVLTYAMCEDTSHIARMEAAAILARSGELLGPANVLWVLDAANRPPTRLHRAILRASARTHTDELVHLCQLERYAYVRPLLVESLGWCEDFSRLEVLERMAQAPEPGVRVAALKAARQLGHPGAADWVMASMLDPEPFVRIHAANACAALDLTSSIPLLKAMLRDSSWWVRMRAAQALRVLDADGPPMTAAIGLR